MMAEYEIAIASAGFPPLGALDTGRDTASSLGTGEVERGEGFELEEPVAAGAGSDLLNSFENAPNIYSELG